MTHRYAEALRWIAEGKHVQIRWGSDERWLELKDRNEIVNDEILRGMGAYQFRLKPRTVKIGSREVEAPVLEPEDGRTLWFTNSLGVPQAATFDGGTSRHDKRAASGRLFASEKAAVEAHEAVTALLRGKSC